MRLLCLKRRFLVPRALIFRGGTPQYEALGPEADSKELAVLQRPLASGRSLAEF